MAGAGRKVWGAETVTYPDLQNYLQDQVVQVYASAAARTAAVPSPSEGMASYLSDLDRLDLYDGAAWQPVAYTALQLTRGVFTGSTDGTGSVSFAHGLGVAPASVQLTPASSALQHLVKYVVVGITSTNVGVAMYRTDTVVVVTGNPIAFYWVAHR